MRRCKLFFVTERWSSFVRTAAVVSPRLSVLGPGLATINPEANGQLSLASLRHTLRPARYKPRFIVPPSLFRVAPRLVFQISPGGRAHCISQHLITPHHYLSFAEKWRIPVSSQAKFSCSTSAGGPLDEWFVIICFAIVHSYWSYF